VVPDHGVEVVGADGLVGADPATLVAVVVAAQAPVVVVVVVVDLLVGGAVLVTTTAQPVGKIGGTLPGELRARVLRGQEAAEYAKHQPRELRILQRLIKSRDQRERHGRQAYAEVVAGVTLVTLWARPRGTR
jgi:hypothetical protein